MSDTVADDAVRTAIKYRDRARTYNTSVGAAVEMFDGSVYGGFNMENKRHDGLHAERFAINNGLEDGYNATDFNRLVVVYQDADSDTVEAFPACLGCQAWAHDYTHPHLQIEVADTDGDVFYEAALTEIVDPPGDAKVYPSTSIRESKPLQNSTPQLPLDETLRDAYESDEAFRAFCDAVDVDVPW